MSTTTTRNRNAPLARGDTAIHLFAVGQTVRLKSAFTISASKSSGIYRITRRLPPEGSLVQYRIRNDDEPHERVASQDSLEVVKKQPSESDGVFISGTFDRDRQDRHRDHGSERKKPARISLSASPTRKRSIEES